MVSYLMSGQGSASSLIVLPLSSWSVYPGAGGGGVVAHLLPASGCFE